MTIEDAIKYGYEKLNSRLESELLLNNIINKSKLFIITHPKALLSEYEEASFTKSVSRRFGGEPLAYIIGKKEFYGRDFYVNENVLIPRPETEMLVELALECSPLRALDMCTGSGCIGITLSIEGNINVTCVDISEKALLVARKNHEILGGNVEFIKSNMFENINGKFDLIVSNPPYIPKEEIKTLHSDVQKEPIIALDGGEDGLDFYRILFTQGKNYLNKNGNIIVEIGYNQSEDIEKLAKSNGFKIKFFKDLQGYKRDALLEYE